MGPLPPYFKLHIVNNLNNSGAIQFSTDGANNSFVVKAIPWKFTTNGAISRGSEITALFDDGGASDLSNGDSLEGSEYDNSSNNWLGMHCRAISSQDSTEAGSVDVFIEYSTSGSASGAYPSDAADFDAERDLIPVAHVIQAGTAVDVIEVNFEIGFGAQ